MAATTQIVAALVRPTTAQLALEADGTAEQSRETQLEEQLQSEHIHHLSQEVLHQAPPPSAPSRNPIRRRTRLMVRRAMALALVAPARSRSVTLRGSQRLCPLADGGERGYHMVRQHPLAVEATPSRGAAVVRHQLERVRRREAVVYGEDVADVGVTRVLPGDARRVGGRGLELLPDGLGRIEDGDRVAEALGHLSLAVEPENPFRGRE